MEYLNREKITELLRTDKEAMLLECRFDFVSYKLVSPKFNTVYYCLWSELVHVVLRMQKYNTRSCYYAETRRRRGQPDNVVIVYTKIVC